METVMERRFQAQLQKMLVQAEVPPDLVNGLMERLTAFAEPYASYLSEPEQRQHTVEYLKGLLSKLDRKTGEGIAYLHDQERQGIQKFIGHVDWDQQPLLRKLAEQVAADLGETDGVIVFDPSSFPKKGAKSVGVSRQWCGRLGKLENCQVGVYMGYVSRKEHALVNLRLYLPQEWAKARTRRTEASVPKKIQFQTRQELALEMLDEQQALLPHAWVAGDDEMGRPASFRLALREHEQRYLLAVPSNTLVRDLDTPAPPYSGRGRHPKSPWTRVDRWCRALPESRWTRIDVRDGEKGPLVVEGVKCRVQARAETGGSGPDEVLFITRKAQGDGTFKHDYYLSNAEPDVALEEFTRVAKAAHRIEDCFKRAKGEAGLADYQGRNWRAWHHHQALALLAAWFLNQETRRGKNRDAGVDDAATEATDRRGDRGTAAGQPSGSELSSLYPLAEANRVGTALCPSLT
jgi:SRSO17 transposase